MKEQNRRLLTPALVIAGCVALLLVVIALAAREGSSDDSAAVGFPVVLVGLAVVSVVGMLVWKAVSRSKSDSKEVVAGDRRRCGPTRHAVTVAGAIALGAAAPSVRAATGGVRRPTGTPATDLTDNTGPVHSAVSARSDVAELPLTSARADMAWVPGPRPPAARSHNGSGAVRADPQRNTPTRPSGDRAAGPYRPSARGLPAGDTALSSRVTRPSPHHTTPAAPSQMRDCCR